MIEEGGSELVETDARWPDSWFTTHDGVRLHYVEIGAGAPVILLHGIGGSAVGSWFKNGIAQRLARSNRVLALDLRGFGLSEGLAAPQEDMSGDVLALLAHIGEERAHIAGYSMGGGILMRMMAKCPERFITACFQASGILETEEWRDRLPPDVIGPGPDETRALAQIRAKREARGEETGNVVVVQPPSEERRVLTPTPAWLHAREMGLDLTNIDFPVMAITGEYDWPMQRTHRMWRELRDFTNLILPGKGHLSAMMPGFIPQAFIEGFAGFVERNNPRD